MNGWCAFEEYGTHDDDTVEPFRRSSDGDRRHESLFCGALRGAQLRKRNGLIGAQRLWN